MIRFKPNYSIYARPIDEYPAKINEAAAIMLMIQNNLNEEIAQHPQELITYGGNGAVFQNWAQYLLTMKYLAEINNNQTLHLYSGHPMGLFPSSKKSPRLVITNGMMIPNYSKPDDWEKFNALGVTQYGQMTAGSFMYIGPQGIVHGTTITLMNAFRKVLKKGESVRGKIFLTSGLGGMSGAQPKAGNIVGCISVTAEVNHSAAKKRHDQGWVDKLVFEINELVKLVKEAQLDKKIVSFAYIGNIVDVWEAFFKEEIDVTIGSDQTSLHNPWSGGYYPVDLNYEEANTLLKNDPMLFKKKVQESLKKHSKVIKMHVNRGTYFFDYGNAFLLEASRAGADVMNDKKTEFRYPSYVQDILGPICFDNGFGPFRWVCASGKEEDLKKTDEIAKNILIKIKEKAPKEIQAQLDDNIKWIKDAQKHKLVVGSKARILYADSEGRIKIAKAFNEAISKQQIGKVILGRDHHDVSGTDSPYRETSNIYDGSQFTADMAIHNVIGDSFRGATWVSIHNGGGVGWGEVINGGFGMLLDGTKKAEKKLERMLFFDVNNGIARRSWARNKPAIRAIKHEMKRTDELKVIIPEQVDDSILDSLYK
jgi:urocanate hydratase